MADYIMCFGIVVVILFEIALIVKRNKTIDLKGKDGFFAITMILFLAIVIFPMDVNNTMVESLRNTLVFVAIFGSVGVKRGFSEKGIEKLFFAIKWNQITGLYVEEYQVSKIMLRVVTSGKVYKLYFNKIQVKQVIKYLQDRDFQVNISETLQI